MEPFIVSDFSGGITDEFLSALPKYAKELDNFLLDEDGKPYTRSGLAIHPERLPVSIGATRCYGIYAGPTPFGLPVFLRGDKAYNLLSTNLFNEILGPTGNVAVPNKTNASQESAVMWSDQLIYASSPDTVLPHRIYCNALGPPSTFVALTLGLPALSGTPGLSSAGGTGHNYLYAAHYYYEFLDYDGVLYVEQGPVTVMSISNVGTPDTNTITVGSGTPVPTLANTSSTNYDTVNVKIKLFRSTDNGATFYALTTLNNGTTTYADSTSDTVISQNEPIYTDGDVVEFTPPPAGIKYITQANDYFFMANDRELYQSIQGAPGACPEEYISTLDQKIKGLASIISFPILFCDQHVYRLEGVFDEFGDGGYEFKEISKVAGCIAHRSIVSIPGGLVWAGNGGFWFTDGNKCSKIAVHLATRYQTWRNQSIAGAYDPDRNIVFWTISSSQNSALTANDGFVALHLNFGGGEKSCFTTFGSYNNIFPTALAYSSSYDVTSSMRSKLLVADTYGYVMYMDDLAFTDPLIDNFKYPSEMVKKAIIMRYESAGLDLGGEVARAYSTILTYELRNETDLAINFLSRRDESGAWGEFGDTRQDGGIIWGISEYGWNDPDDTLLHDWNSQKLIEGKRWFPRQTLRSTRRQIGLTNATVYIAKSDDVSTADVVSASKSVTLTDSATYFPGDCEGYEIGFGDSPTSYYQIKARVSDTQLTLYDPYLTLTDQAAVKWQMRGQRKFERAYLLSYTVNFTPDGMTQSPATNDTPYTNAP